MPVWGWILISVVLTVIGTSLGKQRFGDGDRLEIIDYTSQKVIIYYQFPVRHARIQCLCKILHLISPLKLEWRSPYSSKLSFIDIASKNSVKEKIGNISHVEFRHVGEDIKIIWPRGKLIEKLINFIEIELSGHISRGEIQNMIMVDKDRIKSAPRQRWRYELENNSDATIRDFELDITNLSVNPRNICLKEARPIGTITEADIYVKAETPLDSYKIGADFQPSGVICQLPNIEKNRHITLIFEC